MSSTSTSVENYQLVFTLVTHIFSLTTTMPEYLKRKMFRGGKVSRFLRIVGNRETITPENHVILLNFKQFKCNTAKLFLRITNVRSYMQYVKLFHRLTICVKGSKLCTPSIA